MSTFTAGMITRASLLEGLVPQFARKINDNAAVNNSTTFVNDSDLFLTVSANSVYVFEANIRYSSNNTADIKFRYTFPTNTTMRFIELSYIPAGTLQVSANTELSPISAQGSTGQSFWRGLVITSTVSGVLQLQFAQDTANVSNTFTQAGAYMMAQKVA